LAVERAVEAASRFDDPSPIDGRTQQLTYAPVVSISATEFDTVMLVARVVVGVTIFVHGYNKAFRGGRIPGTANWFAGLGMRPNGTVHAYAAAATELGTGVLLCLGLLTPLAAAGVIGICTVAAWVDHRGAFLMFKNGFEYVLVLATLCAVIGAFGPGAWSLDAALGLDTTLTEGWRGLAIAVILGVGTGLATLLLFWRPLPADDDAT
jgi:putative oxidoreductase